ncbi:MAG: alpha/beta hydrolase [Planctomycetota bacterium]
MRSRLASPLLLVFLFTLTVAQPATAQKKRLEPPPEPRPVMIPTKDGNELSGYYFGSNKGKEAIPVLLVHEWKGQKNGYGPLCLALRDAGCAVLAFDYRGHGGSREIVDGSGRKKQLNLQTMRKRDIETIVRYDIEAAKRWLIKENNEERLNLNALVVVGVRDGSVLATAWAQTDWQFPNIGSRKQGHDVKALVFVSPKRQLKGIPIESLLQDRNIAALPTMVIYGKGSSEENDGERIHKRIGVNKRKLAGGLDPEGLELLAVAEPLGGPDLIKRSKKVIPEVVKFITEEVKISDIDNPWIKRD